MLEGKFYADTAGTVTTQQRVRLYPVVEALAVDPEGGQFETMRTLAAPVGRGWEYATGADGVVDWDAALDELPLMLAEKLAAPGVEAGRYDLVVDPSNLWLTIHESIGHATEARPGTRVRGQLRGDVLPPRRTSSARYGTARR